MTSLYSLIPILTGMSRPGVVRTSVLVTVLTTLLTISQIDLTSAKALGLDENYWTLTNDVGKRNSWWSKKSLESAPDYQRLLKEAAYRDTSLNSPSAESETEDNISSLYSCYVQTCAPEFIQCAQGSRTFSVYSECKARHHLCALKCWVDLTESKFV